MRSFFKVTLQPQQITKAAHKDSTAVAYSVEAAIRRHEAAFGDDSLSPAASWQPEKASQNEQAITQAGHLSAGH